MKLRLRIYSHVGMGRCGWSEKNVSGSSRIEIFVVLQLLLMCPFFYGKVMIYLYDLISIEETEIILNYLI